MRAIDFLIENNNIYSEIEQFQEYINNKYNVKSFMISKYRNNAIKLDTIIVNNKNMGTGTDIMNELTNFADNNKLIIYLNPANRDYNDRTISRNRLVNFYKRFGFYENKGRKKDFHYMGGMLRYPKEDE